MTGRAGGYSELLFWNLHYFVDSAEKFAESRLMIMVDVAARDEPQQPF